MITVYTDGGCHNTGRKKGLGSYAFLQPLDRTMSSGIIINGGRITNTTNNRTEMLAIINAIKYYDSDMINIMSDSKYVVKGWNDPRYFQKWSTNGWITSGGKHVQNIDLWSELSALSWHKRFTLTHMKGHMRDGDGFSAFWNNICDRACTFLMNNINQNGEYMLEYDFLSESIKNYWREE